ncbi:MAG: nucleotidyltransferase family protein [Erysipelotrichales bacterium]|nr:nucleotidyltransferase family protein [Erysipelotrichales bacterium]
MKATGIITEYSPFHNGHIYHIQKTRELLKPDCLIATISGNFTMRGAISSIEKYHKAQLALNHGVDLVVEIPFPYVNQQADYFAYGAISLLEQLSVTDFCFGSEANDLKKLQEKLDYAKTVNYQKALKANLKKGLSYSQSSMKTIDENIQSNDILGISYLKAIENLKANLKPYTIQRVKSNHRDTTPNDSSIASATALRNLDDISFYVPKEVTDYKNKYGFSDLSDFFSLLHYKLGTTEANELKDYLHVNEGIENLFKKKLVNNYNEFIASIQTKRYTANRINRTLISILTEFKQDIFKLEPVPYINILGFNESGRKYLNKLKKEKQDLIFLPQKKDFTNPILSLSRKADFIYYAHSKSPKPLSPIYNTHN